MTPDDTPSPLATLRQLKEMLDAGAITPQEFEALKQRLVFGAAPVVPPVAEVPPLPPATPLAEVPPTPYLDDAAALTPEATPLLAPEPDWLAAPAPLLLTPDDADDAEPAGDYDHAPPAERRNPLNLVFAIGGLLLFLGVMAYLAWGRARIPDEHLTTLSQTVADTTTVVPETGPQAEQLTLPPAAAPETLRVAAPVPRPVAADTVARPPAATVAPAATAPAATTAPVAAPKTTPAKSTAPAADTAAAGQ